MIGRMEKLKRRLEALDAEEQRLHEQSAKRIAHLQELHRIPSLVDTAYVDWSKTRLDRMVVDYLLRQGYSGTAAALAEAKSIPDLVDLDTFTACHKVADSIQRGSTVEALQWIKDNRDGLKKLLEKSANSATNEAGQPISLAVQPKITNLEFELRFQEFIELLRHGPQREAARYDALLHAQKYFTPHIATHAEQNKTAAGLLTQDPTDVTGPYASYFLPKRWAELAQAFVETHHQLLNLPLRPLLHIALSPGLSALKTPACHSSFNPASSTTSDHPKIATMSGNPSHTGSIGTSLCPICSTEVNELAKTVPYAHHTKSIVEPEAVVLPNGRIYGRQRLEDLQRKQMRAQGLAGSGGRGDEQIGKAGTFVTDPVTGTKFDWAKVKKVYIS